MCWCLSVCDVIIFFKQSVPYRIIVFSIYIDQYYAVIMPYGILKIGETILKIFKSVMYKRGLISIYCATYNDLVKLQ